MIARVVAGTTLVAAVLMASYPAETWAQPCSTDPEALAEVESQASRFLAAWEDARPAPAIGADVSMTVARCIQRRIVEKLAPEYGRIVGYKAGLTSKAVQERFGVDQPVRGTLLEGMILADGSIIPTDFGARPVWEADMLLVVADDDINEATTAEQAMAHIRGMHAFVELPDLAIGADAKMTGTVMTAINVGARYGVAGPEVPLEPGAATVEALRDVRVVVTDGEGKTLSENTGAATLGTPLNAVLWLISDLVESGRRLRAGDLISVGSFSPLTPPQPGQTVIVRYEGLPGTPRVSVVFEK